MKLRKYLQEETVAQVGYRSPVRIVPETSIAKAIETMQAERVGCVLIVEGDELRGVFTERDVLKRVLNAKRPMDGPVSEVMTPEPEVATETEPICRVLARMHSGGLRHIPIVNSNGKPIGTISVKRVSGFIADHFAMAVYNLPPEPHQYGAAREGA